jgi:hypothetical protein
MKQLVAVLGALALLTIGPIAEGQSPAQHQNVPEATRTVNITAEQRHVIKEIVKDLKLQQAPADAPSTIGNAVPQSVNLQPMPADIAQKVPQVKSHLLYIKGQQVVLVDPKDNTVADVIE